MVREVHREVVVQAARVEHQELLVLVEVVELRELLERVERVERAARLV